MINMHHLFQKPPRPQSKPLLQDYKSLRTTFSSRNISIVQLQKKKRQRLVMTVKELIQLILELETGL
jgi:hypothetical protein